MSDTLATMQTRIAEIINRSDVTNARITGWINDAQRLICRSFNLDLMKTSITASTVDKQQKYELPDGTTSGILRYKQEISCQLKNSNNNRVPLTRRTRRDIEDMEDHIQYPDATTNTGIGTPTEYTCENGYLYLYDAPDHSSNGNTAWTIDLQYYGYLADLSSDSDYNKLVLYYPEILEKVAVSIGYEKWTNEFEKAEYFMNQAKSFMQDIVTAENAERYSTLEEGLEPGRNTGSYPRY